jgi:Periplasmic copper-binding protein (NosD)
MRWTAARGLAAAVAVLICAVGGCGSDAADDSNGSGSHVVHVPEDQPTIQAAVDKANPGDLVMIESGTYTEEITVDTPRLTIRGVDRNGVVLDGNDALNNGITVTAGGVTIENLTVHGYLFNGIVFNGAGSGDDDDGATPDASGEVYGSGNAVLDGYRVGYVTSYDNGLYGIYAFSSRNGEIDHTLTSGHPDSGVYVGQCSPCNVVIHDVISERNAIGYYGTNASGGVYVINSIFRHNRLGLTPNSQKMEELSPQVETVVAGNLVIDNADPDTPAVANGFFGGGIAVGGGTKDVIVRNRVQGHTSYGIGLVSLNPFEPENNRVEGNVLTDNAIDLVYAPSAAVRDAAGNCFTGNTFESSSPLSIETVLPCGSPATVSYPVPAPELAAAPDGVDYRTMRAPDPQPSMPDAATAPAASLPAQPVFPDVAAITVPPPP